METVRVINRWNPAECFVYMCLFVFIQFISLKLDDQLDWNYWLVFSPIWIWKIVTFIAAILGIFVRHCIGSDRIGHHHLYISMIMSVLMQALLLLFELLIVYRLEGGTLSYIIIFSPIYCIAFTCLLSCLWSLQHNRAFEFEFFILLNTFQFFLLSIRLDGVVDWQLFYVLMPIWMMFSLILAAIILSLLLAISIVIRNPRMKDALGIYYILINAMVVIPCLVFLVMLTKKFDENADIPNTILVLPLSMMLIILILQSFNSQSCNPWWFGLRRNYQDIVYTAFPFMVRDLNQIVAPGQNVRINSEQMPDTITIENKKVPPKPIKPALTISKPDVRN